jgi:hypothetical protein
MAITKKPSKIQKSVDQFIENGANEATQQKTDHQKEQIKHASLRLPIPLYEAINRDRAKRPGAGSLHQWIISACWEKLERK